MKAPSRRSSVFCLLLTSLLLCSCKEHEALFKEKADLEIELQKTKEEATQLETQIGTRIGQTLHDAGSALEAKAKASDTATQQLTQEISDLTGKSERLDAALKQFRAKVEAYKAKNLQ